MRREQIFTNDLTVSINNREGVEETMSRDSSDALEDLRYRREKAIMGGGIKRQESIRVSGRGTARDRIRSLLDEDSFVEIDTFLTHRTSDHGMFMHETLGDGVVCGHGTVDGRRIYCFAQDFSVHGGSMGEMHAKKISKVVEMAERTKVPIVGIWDGGGQRALIIKILFFGVQSKTVQKTSRDDQYPSNNNVPLRYFLE